MRKFDDLSEFATAISEQGGPAFPCEFKIGDVTNVFSGMSLRDYFAAAAIQGLLASVPTIDPNQIGWMAYTAADALIKYRSDA